MTLGLNRLPASPPACLGPEFLVPRRNTPPVPTTPCRELWNLSDLTADWLADLGVHTYAELCEADLFELWRELKSRHRQTTKLMYLALWGAVHNVHWNQVPQEEQDRFELLRSVKW
jgi:DNA transformation protein and related proteins